MRKSAVFELDPPSPVASPSSQDRDSDPTPPASPRVRFARTMAITLAICAAIGGIIWTFDRPAAEASSQAITLTETAKGPPPRIGSPAPRFQLISADGHPVDLENYRGRPVWITFWATWCPPCRAESPEIKAAYERHADAGLVVLAIDVGEDVPTVDDYVQKAGLPFIVGMDRTTAVAAMYRVRGLPTHFFVDADGILRDVKIGPMGSKEIERKLAPLISPSTPR